MAISEAIQRKAQSAIVAIRNSSLPMEMQDNLVDAVESTKETTNGLSADEKLQATTENQFAIVRIMIMHILSEHKHPNHWKEVIVECKREIAIIIVVLGVLLSLMLCIQPKIADNIDHIVTHKTAEQQTK